MNLANIIRVLLKAPGYLARFDFVPRGLLTKGVGVLLVLGGIGQIALQMAGAAAEQDPSILGGNQIDLANPLALIGFGAGFIGLRRAME